MREGPDGDGVSRDERGYRILGAAQAQIDERISLASPKAEENALKEMDEVQRIEAEKYLMDKRRELE